MGFRDHLPVEEIIDVLAKRNLSVADAKLTLLLVTEQYERLSKPSPTASDAHLEVLRQIAENTKPVPVIHC